jgi:hypothetical protein
MEHILLYLLVGFILASLVAKFFDPEKDGDTLAFLIIFLFWPFAVGATLFTGSLYLISQIFKGYLIWLKRK